MLSVRPIYFPAIEANRTEGKGRLAICYLILTRQPDLFLRDLSFLLQGMMGIWDWPGVCFAVVLRFPFTETKGLSPNHGKQPQAIIPPLNLTVGATHSGR